MLVILAAAAFHRPALDRSNQRAADPCASPNLVYLCKAMDQMHVAYRPFSSPENFEKLRAGSENYADEKTAPPAEPAPNKR
jgi:hypothetical protein